MHALLRDPDSTAHFEMGNPEYVTDCQPPWNSRNYYVFIYLFIFFSLRIFAQSLPSLSFQSGTTFKNREWHFPVNLLNHFRCPVVHLVLIQFSFKTMSHTVLKNQNISFRCAGRHSAGVSQALCWKWEPLKPDRSSNVWKLLGSRESLKTCEISHAT